MILGISIPVAIFRAFAPNDVYPVHYGARGKTAHLDVTGRRGEAVKVAMKDQLGFEVVSMKPVGLEGSGGSTPLKMQVIDEEGQTRSVFAKLYARNHVRADRWYKLGRTMLLRPPGGRDAVQHGPAIRGVRGLHPAAPGRVRASRPRRHSASSRSRPSAST